MFMFLDLTVLVGLESVLQLAYEFPFIKLSTVWTLKQSLVFDIEE